jgi:hypothetical protein
VIVVVLFMRELFVGKRLDHFHCSYR